MTFLPGCLASRWRHVALAFDSIDLLLHHDKPVDLALDLTGDSRRQAATSPVTSVSFFRTRPAKAALRS
jgi:hypothetical protein